MARKPRSRDEGFSLIELAIVLSITGVLAAMATTRYLDYVERARVVSAIADIRNISMEIEEHLTSHEELPADLSEIGHAGTLDPWGNPYGYLPLIGMKGNAQARKDRFLVPINSDFDLYSAGPDGLSKPPLRAKDSRDDIIRANDGSFIGLADRF